MAHMRERDDEMIKKCMSVMCLLFTFKGTKAAASSGQKGFEDGYFAHPV